MGNLRWIARATALVAGFGVGSYAGGAHALEARVFAIGDFVPSGSGGCGGNDIGHWPDMVDEWYDEMGSHGHIKDGQHTNGNMVLTRFCDPDWNASCQDDDFVDEADAAMIGTHGADSGDHWQGVMRWPSLGHCRLDGGGVASEMYVGDVDLEFIHLSSCQSADDDNLDGIRFAMRDPVDTHSVGMAYAWVTNHYHNDSVDCEWYDPFDWFDTCDDQCPIGYSIGTSEANALSRLNNERYNNVYSDPTSHSFYAYMYYEGCNPVGESSFNP
jgi:hypothetical protein